MTTELAARRVSELIQETLENENGVTPFTPEQVEERLSERAFEARYLKLTAVPSIAPGGVDTFTRFDAPYGYDWWEDTVTLYDGDYNEIDLLAELKSADHVVGSWTLNNEPDPLPVYLLGISYDPYGTAYDLLIELSARWKTSPASFSRDGGSFTWTDSKMKGVVSLAKSYLRRARRIPATGL